MKNVFLTLCLVVLCTSPAVSQAQISNTNTDAERRVLLLQIQTLLQEIIRLQALLALQNPTAETNTSDVSPTLPDNFESEFYTGRYVATYNVRNGELPATATTQHQALWEHFTNVVGSIAARQYFAAVHIYSDENHQYDAFVETPDGKGWVLAINTAYVALDSEAEQQQTTELFVHEYAHVLAYYESDFVAAFTDEFWTSKDTAQSERILGRTSYDAIERLSDTYYDDNKERFVSSYATISPEEDIAESFLNLVLYGYPRANTDEAAKQRFVYSNHAFRDATEVIRTNLGN